MTTPTAATLPPPGATARSRPAAHLLAAGRDQAVVAGGQLLAGAGNLAFVAIAARLLPPTEFGHLATFVALLTVLHLPGAGLAAAGAITPRRAVHLARRAVVLGVLAGALMAGLAGPASDLSGLPVPFVLALAAAAPVAPVLGLRRGLAYGTRDHRAVVASLLAEPAARLGLGLSLGLLGGAAGAAWGAAAGGWLALAVLWRAGARGEAPAHRVRGAAAGATSVVFIALAVLQHQDLVLAHRLLGASEAGAFAALSTVGGLVAFATATLPLVLLPSASRDEAGGLQVAVGAALVVGAVSVGVALLAADSILLAVVGPGYEQVAPLVPPYLAAMGALGVARVLAAQRCARGGSRRVAHLVGGIAVAHVAALVAIARTPGQVVAVTSVALASTAGLLALPTGWDDSERWSLRDRLAEVLRRPDAHLLVVLTVIAVALRLATERSFWIDEAVSVRQVQMPFGGMLDDLRGTDVHPPLHYAFLWVTVRVLGTAEWAVRLPSVLFGAALVPAMYAAARELFDRRTGRIAAALAVPAPFLVWYSQEARMYALFMLIGVLGVWAQVAALRRGRPIAFAAWAAASASLLWTQWFAVLPLAVQQVATVAHLVRRRREHPGAPRLVWKWLGSLVLTAVLVLPLVPFLTDQLAAYGERGAGLSMPATAGADSSSVAEGLSPYAVIANLLWAVGGYHNDDVMVRLGALWPLAVLGCLLLLGRRMQWGTRLLMGVALLPGVALFVIAHSKRDLFELRYFVLAAPLLLIVVARAVASGTRTRLAAGTVVAGLLALSSVALVDQQLNGTNPRLYDFRGAVEEIERTAGPDDVLAYAPSYLDGVLGYYAPQLDGAPLGEVDPDEVDGQIFVVVSARFLTKATAGPVGAVLADLEQERGRPERIERPNVVVWRFS